MPAHAGEVPVFSYQADPSLKPLQAAIHEACGNPPDADLADRFKCLRGAAAVPALERGVSRSGQSVALAWSRFLREVPRDLRVKFAQTCKSLPFGDIKYWDCVKGVLQQKPPGGASSDATYNRDAALRELSSLTGATLRRGVWAYACVKAADMVNSTSDGGMTLRERGPSEPGGRCLAAPPFTPSRLISFTPSAGGPPSAGGEALPEAALYEPHHWMVPESNVAPTPCDGIIPRAYCGSGTAVDPFAVASESNLPMNEGLLDDIYQMQRAAHLEDWGEFLASRALERSLELAYLGFPPGAARTERLKKISDAAGACQRPGKQYPQTLQASLDRSVSTSQEAWLEGLGGAARCMSVNVDRWQALRSELGFDIRMTSTVISPAEMEKLPIGVRHLAKGVTGLPFLRQFLLEMPLPTGFNEAATRNCGFLQEQVAGEVEVSGVVGAHIPRRAYCRAAYSEFLLLTHEMNDLYSRYPILAERDPAAAPLYQAITAAQGGPGTARVASPGDRKSCAEAMRSSGGNPLGPDIESQVAGLASPAVDAQVDVLLNQVKASCDPEELEALVALAIKRPGLNEQFFSCSRPRMTSLATHVMPDAEKGAGAWFEVALAPAECARRKDSSWLACRYLDEVRRKEGLREGASLGLQMAMDMLTFVTPIGGLTEGISLRAVATGATVGGGIGYVVAPSAADAALPYQFDAAEFISGAGSFQDYESAVSSLDALAARDPKWEAAITGALMGGGFAALGGKTGVVEKGYRGFDRFQAGRRAAELIESNPALWSVEMDLELISVYRALDEAGAYADDLGASVKKKLEDLFEKRLAQKYPSVPKAEWKRFPVNEQLGILQGTLEPPRVRGPPGGQVAAALDDGAGRTAAVPDPVVPTQSFTPAQARFVESYAQPPASVSAIDSGKNAGFIFLAEQAASRVGKAAPRALQFFEVENAVLKALNDRVFQSKTVVDAVENRWRDILLNEIRSDPRLKVALRAKYQDFKSLRFAFDSSPEVQAAFSEAFSRATRIFSEEMKAGPYAEAFASLEGKLGDPARWHMAAAGSTVDEAGAAARYARALDLAGGVPLQTFEHAATWVQSQARNAESLRNAFVSSLSKEASKTLLKRSGGPLSSLVPSEGIFELVRKVDLSNRETGLSELGSKIKNRYGVELSPVQLRDLVAYSQAVDAFSVGLLIEKRVAGNLHLATGDILSADFAGQGGRNLTETAAALARTSQAAQAGDMATVIRAARDAEVRATEGMQRLNSDFRRALEDTVGQPAVAEDLSGGGTRLSFSGDDGIFLAKGEWTHSQRLDLASRLAQVSDTPSNFRLTWVPTQYPNGTVIDSALRSQLVVQAELAEKSLRAALEGKVPREILSRTVMMVEFVPEPGGGGTIRVILSGKENLFGGAAARESLLSAAQSELSAVISKLEAGNPGKSFVNGGVDYIKAGTRPPKGGDLPFRVPSLPEWIRDPGSLLPVWNLATNPG